MANSFFDWPASLTRFIRFDAARAEEVNNALDEVSTGFEGVETKTNAAIKGPDGETNAAIPAKASRINKVLTFDGSGNAVTTYAIADVATVAGIEADVTAVAGIAADVTTVADNDANVTTVATNIASVNATGGSIANVNAVATNIANVNAVAADATDIGTVSSNIANVNTVAGISANVTTVAGNSANVTTVAGIASDVTTVATNNANVTTVATNIADVNTVAGANANISTVATDIANINTVAGISADVSAVAGISSDVSAVAAQFIGWNFSTTTTMADPGSGIMRLNNATLASVTAIAFDDLNSAAADVSGYVTTWGDGTSTIKGTITIRQGTANFAIFNVTGLTDNAGWTQVAVTHVSSSGTFSDATLTFVDFDKTGDAGTGDVNGPSSSVDSEIALFSGTGGKTLKRASTTGILKASSGVVSAATQGTDYGYVDIPQSGSDKTTSYTLATTDNGKFIGVGSGGSIEIPNSTFSAGNAVTIFNNTTGNVTITCTITTAYIAGTDSDKATMTLATRGVANILFLSGTVCVVTGNVS